MSEKYITLNHLETATKSLIAKIDEEINDLSPVAQSGDYEDLENKPNLSQIAYTGSYEDLINPPDGVKYLNIDRTYYYDDLKELVKGTCSSIILYDAVDYTDETLYNFYYLTNKSGGWRTQSGTINLTFLGETKKVTCSINKDDTDPVVFVETPITTETPTPDWDQNDSTADDYIENRTHWKDIDEDFVWFDGSFVWNTSTLKSFKVTLRDTLLWENEEYIVTYDNVDYNLTSYPITSKTSGEIIYALGNSNYAPSSYTVDSTHDTSVPFCIFILGNSSSSGGIRRQTNTSDTSTHSLKITGPIYVYHTINNFYLNGKLITRGIGNNAEVFNNNNEASGTNSHAEGSHTTASGAYSHTEGFNTVASKNTSHAEGYYTIASENGSHSEGIYRGYTIKLTGAAGATTYTVTRHSSAAKPPRFTDLTTANRIHVNSYEAISFTVGEDSRINSITFAETLNADSAWTNKATTLYIWTVAAGEASHAEGNGTLALGEGSHSEGIMTEAIGTASHAQNQCTVAQGDYQTAIGIYNIADTTSALIVGNGSQDAYSNAYTLDWSGNGVYAGKVTVGTAPTADMDVATKLYVDTAMSNISTDLVGLTDTTITTPTDGQILIYDATNSKWINSNFTAVSAESDTNVNDMLDDFSLDYTSDFLSPNMWVGGRY